MATRRIFSRECLRVCVLGGASVVTRVQLMNKCEILIRVVERLGVRG